MAQSVAVSKKTVWFKHAGKVIAVAASSGAALVSIFSALYSYGVIGESESHQSIGNLGASWVGVRPVIDTAFAIGDTVHFAATVTDKNGSILVGARPVWTTGDSSVATVLPDGSVVARGPGKTMVSVVVGKLVAHSRVLVSQRVASVDIEGPAHDTTFSIAEGAELQLVAKALDARGHRIADVSAVWHVDDNSVAGLDSTGTLVGKNAGRTVISAKIDGVASRTGVSVVTPAAALALVAGTSQRAVAGKTLPQAVVVRATNRRGAPASGKVVSFRLTDGQGKVEPAMAVTDADGRARTLWTLGAYPGRQTLFASVENVDSALPVMAEADPVANNTRVAALTDRFSGKAGETLIDSASVRVTDSTGRVLPDVPVRWMAGDGGLVSLASTRTDSLGVASVRWTLSRKVGTQHLRAQIGTAPGDPISPVTLTATALAGAASSIVVVSGDAQKGVAGSDLRKPVILRVVDENGNGVIGANLSLSASSGSLADTVLATDSTGSVHVSWTMGRSAGDQTLAAHVEGVKKLLRIIAHVAPAQAANLAFDDPPGEKKSRESGKKKSLLAVVTDVYGNPVPDAKVSFSTKFGTVTPARAVSDAKGRAALVWKLGGKGGEQRLLGSVRGTDVTGEYVLDLGTHEPVARTASLRSGH
jgi:hypothetical protein